jgi:hypothetical protein
MVEGVEGLALAADVDFVCRKGNPDDLPLSPKNE